MATDFISRDAAIEAIRSECVGCVGQQFGERFCSKCAIRQREVALYSVPTADVRPVVREIWIEIDDYVLCANCGVAEHSPNRNYCHNCGADMRKVVEIDQIKEDVR